MTKVEWNLPIKLREQILFVGVLLAVSFASMRVVYTPQKQKLAKINGQLSTLSLEKSSLDQAALIPPPKIKPLSRRKDIKIRILSGDIVPDYQEVSLLLTRLTEPNFLGGMLIQDLSYAPPVAGDGYESVDFKMKLRGSFVEMLRYIEKMEGFPALFSVENLNIHVVEGQQQEVEAEILGRFFKISVPGAATAAPKAPTDKKAKNTEKKP